MRIFKSTVKLKTNLKIFGAFIILLILLFIGYNLKYQHLVNEGSTIAEEQCLKVNPLIAERKEVFSNTFEILQASGNVEEYWDAQNKYIKVSTEYIKAQKDWLDKEKRFMGGWDFKLLTSQDIQEIAKLQYQAREADVKSQSALVEAFEISELNSEIATELAQTSLEESNKRDKLYKELDELWSIHDSKFNLLAFFIRFPTSSCPEEGNIPEIRQEQHPEPSEEPLGCHSIPNGIKCNDTWPKDYPS